MQATLVCVFCSQLVDQSVSLSFSLLQFLSTLLSLPGTQLPAKVCSTCHLGASDCHAFQQRCLRSIKKVAKTEVCPAMVLGRSEDEVRQVKEAFQDTLEEGESRTRKTVQLHQENRSLLEQASKEYGDPQLLVRKPCVSVSSGERRVAELALQGLERQQVKEERKMEQSRRTGKSTWNCIVREEKVDEEEESEAEMFPSFGPYQCEICQAIIETKQEFVKHIKTLHKGMVDKAVLQSLELDLKKKKKRERRNLKKHAERNKLNTMKLNQEKSSEKVKLKKKARRKRNQHGGSSDSEDEYIPNKRKDIQMAKPKTVPNDIEVLSKDPVMPKQTTNAAKLDNSEESKSTSTERLNTDDNDKPTKAKVSSLLRSFRREPAVKEKLDSVLANSEKEKANSSHTVARLLAVETPQYEKHPLVSRRLSALDNDTTFNFKASIAKRYEAERSVENVKLVEANPSDLCQGISKVTTIDICEDVSSSGEKETELLRSSFDRLTQEMAALHGAAGSNTPWREMHDTFFG